MDEHVDMARGTLEGMRLLTCGLPLIQVGLHADMGSDVTKRGVIYGCRYTGRQA